MATRKIPPEVKTEPLELDETSNYGKDFAKKLVQNEDIDLKTRNPSKYKSYKCSLCEKSVDSVDKLIAHMEAHSKKKAREPYECSWCGKQIKAKADYDRHVRTRTGEKSYDCSVCSKKFSRKDS